MIPSNKYTAKVSIWDAEAENGRCGHASLSLVKKTEKGTEKRHIGFWPKFPGSANPATFFLPVFGTYVRENQHDMLRESYDTEPYPPSNVYSIELNEDEFNLMNKQLTEDKENIKDGRVFFSLFPRFNVLKAAQIINEQAHTCLISQLPMEHEVADSYVDEMHNFMRTENCATTVGRVLRSGNLNVQEKRGTPWGLSPMGLSVQISNLTSHQVKVTEKRNWTQKNVNNGIE